MKINTSRSHKKIIVTTIVLIVAAIAGAAGYYWYTRTLPKPDRPENSVDYNKPTSSQQAAGTEARKEFETKQTDASRYQSGDNKSNAPSTPTSVAVQITTASVSGTTLKIRTVIPTIDSSGSCSATLIKSSERVTRQVKTQTMGSYTTCQGFDIPISELSKGTWTVTVDYSGSESRSGRATQEVVI